MLLACARPACADKIYKWTDEHGNVIYSDQPRPGAEELDISTEPAGITPLPADVRPAQKPSEAAKPYDSLLIAAPLGGAVLDDPEGRVSVSIVLAPSLRADQGHAIRLLLDGRVLGTRYAGSEMTLENVERGEHTLQAAVVDASGTALITSGQVAFVQQRPSRLAPRGPDAGPADGGPNTAPIPRPTPLPSGR
jgi:hypothetical protein